MARMIYPPDPQAFYALVWEIVRQIPAGCVSTYGQIASMIPPPEGVEPPLYDRMGARWVGDAMRATPEGSDIPWQRVINSRGQISLPAGSAAADLQRALLEGEGIAFDEQGRADLLRYGWEGPPAAWLAEHGLLPPFSFRPPQDGEQGAQLNLF